LNGAGQFDFSANGTLIYRAARAGSQLKTVQWMDRTGRLEPLVATPDDYRGISLSRDGKRLAIAIADTGLSDLYVYDVERHQEPVRLTVGANIRLGGVEVREALPGIRMAAVFSSQPTTPHGGFRPRDFRNRAS
jgi:hypothetical protein